MRYVALLRGINVGGKAPVNMAALKICCEALGLEQVKTYINSGNVIFTAPAGRQKKLQADLEQAIEKTFKLPIRVLIKTLPEMQTIAQAIPEDWADNPEQKCSVMFLWPEIDTAKTLEKLSWEEMQESVIYTKGAITWHTSKKFAARSKVLRVNQMPIYAQMTLRNPNTVRKLVNLMETTGA